MTPARLALREVGGLLAGDPSTRAIHLGGSVRRGEDDEWSDLDLWIEAEDDWRPDRLGDLWLGGVESRLGGRPFFHGLLRGGAIADFVVGPEPWDGYARQPRSQASAVTPGRADAPSVLLDAWMNSYKHEKVIARGLWPMTLIGMEIDRRYLMRLWAALATGEDPGPGAFSIHGLTPIVRRDLTAARAALLGRPCRTEEECRSTIAVFRDELLACSEALGEAGWQRPLQVEAAIRERLD